MAPLATGALFNAAQQRFHVSKTILKKSATPAIEEVDEDSLVGLFTRGTKEMSPDYTPRVGTAPEEEGTVFDVDSAEAEAKLRRRMEESAAPRKRKSAAPAILLEVDRNRYAQLLYHEHYHVQSGEYLASGKKVDEVGWQSAAMEIQWIEEWALGKAVDDVIDLLIEAGNTDEVAQQHVIGSVWACSSFRSFRELMEIAGEEEKEELEAAAPPKPNNDELDCFRDVYEKAAASIRKAILERVDLQKPLSYILGSQPFYGAEIKCTPPLLIPRPETETWVHWLDNLFLKKNIREGAKANILDLCCGTGCIGVALAKSNKGIKVTAVDFLNEAVQASLDNAGLNNISCGPNGQYVALQGDMFNELLENGAKHGITITPQFDMILSNPPYIFENEYEDLEQSVKKWETKIALVGDPEREKSQWTYFRDLCHEGHKWAAGPADRFERTGILTTAPSVVIEVGSQAEMVAGMFEFSGLWADVQLHLDLKGAPRWVSAVKQPPQPPRVPGQSSGMMSYFKNMWKP